MATLVTKKLLIFISRIQYALLIYRLKIVEDNFLLGTNNYGMYWLRSKCDTHLQLRKASKNNWIYYQKKSNSFTTPTMNTVPMYWLLLSNWEYVYRPRIYTPFTIEQQKYLEIANRLTESAQNYHLDDFYNHYIPKRDLLFA